MPDFVRKALQLTYTQMVGIKVAAGLQQVPGHFQTPMFHPSLLCT